MYIVPFFVVLRLHLPLSGALLEATFAQCSLYSKDEKICGLRPRIKRPVVPSRTPVSYPLDTQPPRKYSRSMQPICNKIALESKLSRDFVANVHFLLYLCMVFGKLLKRRRIQLH